MDHLLSDSGLSVGRSLGGGRGAVSLGGSLDRGVRVLVLLTGAVDGDLDGDFAALNFLGVHLGASLLLKLLRSEGDEPETTTLARLVTCLKLANHEAGNGAEGDLCGDWVVLREDLEKLGRNH